MHSDRPSNTPDSRLISPGRLQLQAAATLTNTDEFLFQSVFRYGLNNWELDAAFDQTSPATFNIGLRRKLIDNYKFSWMLGGEFGRFVDFKQRVPAQTTMNFHTSATWNTSLLSLSGSANVSYRFENYDGGSPAIPKIASTFTLLAARTFGSVTPYIEVYNRQITDTTPYFGCSFGASFVMTDYWLLDAYCSPDEVSTVYSLGSSFRF